MRQAICGVARSHRSRSGHSVGARRCSMHVGRDVDTFGLLVEEIDGGWRIKVSGELGIHAGYQLRRRLPELCSGDRRVVLDLSAVTFIDLDGVGVLLEAQADAGACGRRLLVEPRLCDEVARKLDRMQIRSVLRWTGSSD